MNLKNMRECDNSKIHVSNNSLFIMVSKKVTVILTGINPRTGTIVYTILCAVLVGSWE